MKITVLAKRSKIEWTKRIAAVLCVVAVSLALLACPSGSDDPDPGPSTNPGFPYTDATEVNSPTELKAAISASKKGATAADPVVIKIGKSFKASDLDYEWKNVTLASTTADVEDPFGALYAAFDDNKYVALDLSDISWMVFDDDDNEVKGIPGATSDDVLTARTRVKQEKIAALKFPKDLAIIGDRAFVYSSIKHLDLSGMNKLTYIGWRCFSFSADMETIDFTGCSELKAMGDNAFRTLGKVEMLDLTPLTKMNAVGKYNFRQIPTLKYIELPENIRAFGDYFADYVYSLEYIRFRNPAPSIDWGWGCFLYVMNGNKITYDAKLPSEYNGLPNSHRLFEFGSREPATMQTYVIFHPNTAAWGLQTGTYWTEDAERDYHQGHRVPLPFSGNEKNVYLPDVDKLRGKALLEYNDKIRGQPSVTVSASGLNSSFNGKKVTANIGNVSATITNGAVSLTIPVPAAAELKTLDGETGQIITGKYGNTQAEAHINYSGKITTGSAVIDGDNTWTIDDYTGVEGKPVVWPTTVKFAMLDLTVEGGDKLMRWGKASYIDAWMEDKRYEYTKEEVQAIGYVYVDQDCAIFRYQRQAPDSQGHLRFVYLKLKKGWNQLEAVEILSTDTELDAVRNQNIAIMVSGAIMLENPNGVLPKIRPEADVEGWNWQKFVLNKPFKDIPWVVRNADTWAQIVSPMGTVSLNSPQRQEN